MVAAKLKSPATIFIFRDALYCPAAYSLPLHLEYRARITQNVLRRNSFRSVISKEPGNVVRGQQYNRDRRRIGTTRRYKQQDTAAGDKSYSDSSFFAQGRVVVIRVVWSQIEMSLSAD